MIVRCAYCRVGTEKTGLCESCGAPLPVHAEKASPVPFEGTHNITYFATGGRVMYADFDGGGYHARKLMENK